jgi:hypothetical protein
MLFLVYSGSVMHTFFVLFFGIWWIRLLSEVEILLFVLSFERCTISEAIVATAIASIPALGKSV